MELVFNSLDKKIMVSGLEFRHLFQIDINGRWKDKNHCHKERVSNH